MVARRLTFRLHEFSKSAWGSDGNQYLEGAAQDLVASRTRTASGRLNGDAKG